MGEYEQARQFKISRNKKRLAELGLDKFTLEIAPPPLKKKKPPVKQVHSGPLRRSTRASKPEARSPVAVNTSITMGHSPGPSPFPTFLSIALNASETMAKPGCKWVRSQTHQHITLSAKGYTAATTGCAGYGVALATPARSYSVTPLHFGSGGFAIGLVDQKWQGPLKSMAKNPNACLGAYHNSGLLNENTVPEFFENDRLKVALEDLSGKSGRQACFYLNGELVKKIAIGKADKREFVLAVQPYMGGCARIDTI